MSSYIVLWGKIAIVDIETTVKNIYEAGDTFHEEYFLQYSK
jgi:hypothetical protein